MDWIKCNNVKISGYFVQIGLYHKVVMENNIHKEVIKLVNGVHIVFLGADSSASEQ